MTEEWKDIQGYEGLYLISNTGKVKAICSHVRLQNGVLMKKHLSMSDAYRDTGINFRNISLCCMGKRHTAGGFKWRYA